MASPEHDQDEKIGRLVEQAVQKVREELLERLEETRRQLQGLMHVEAAAEAETVAAPPPGPASLESLHDAVSAIDRARTQTEVLVSLLEGGGRFASRTLLLLARADGLQGWAGHGFAAGGEALAELHLTYDEGSPWDLLRQGRGTVDLTAEDCATLCTPIDGDHPAGGVLVPLVLRDRVAACLYADRLTAEDALDLSGLQLLAYVASRAIETLPLRQVTSSPSLRAVTEEAPALPLLAAAATAEIEEVVEEEAVEEAPAAEAEPVVEPEEEVEPAAEAESEEEAEVPVEEPAGETAESVEVAAVEEMVAEEAAPEVEAEEEPGVTRWGDVEAAEVEEETPEPEVAAEAPTELETIHGAGFAIEEAEVAAVEEEPATDLFPAEEEAEEERLSEAAGAEPEAEAVPEVEGEPEMAAPEVAAEPAGDFEAPTPHVAAPPEPSHSTGSAEVAPPPDLEGPGWAFAAKRGLAGTDLEVQRDEARRLARLLVTEIKLYNEEQVEEGRRQGNIYEGLREDIDRSRQIFEERIDERVRADTDFFHEELVRILASGDASVLGI